MHSIVVHCVKHTCCCRGTVLVNISEQWSTRLAVMLCWAVWLYLPVLFLVYRELHCSKELAHTAYRESFAKENVRDFRDFWCIREHFLAELHVRNEYI